MGAELRGLGHGQLGGLGEQGRCHSIIVAIRRENEQYKIGVRDL